MKLANQRVFEVLKLSILRETVRWGVEGQLCAYNPSSEEAEARGWLTPHNAELHWEIQTHTKKQVHNKPQK